MKLNKSRLAIGAILAVLGLAALEFVTLAQPAVSTDLAMQTVNGSAANYALMRAGNSGMGFITFAAQGVAVVGIVLFVSAFFTKAKRKSS